MKGKHLSLLAIATGIFVLVAILLAYLDAPQSVQSKKWLFPELHEQINDLAEISIQSNEQSLSLVKHGTEWQIKQADHYPARFGKIKQTAVALGDLQILAEKTSNPALYKTLGVEDPLAEEASSLLLSFKDGEKNLLLEIIIGKLRQNKAPGGKPGRYVRLPESEQALLVEGEINVSVDATDWFARELLNIRSERIRSVQIRHGDHAEIKIHRDDKEAAFTLEPIPAGRTSDAAAIARLPALLENIYIDNVQADEDQLADAESVLTTVTTFDGLVARINSAEIDGKPSIKLAFAYEQATAEEKDSQSADSADDAADAPAVKTEIEQLNQRVSNWRYEIPVYQFELFRKRAEDLLEKTEDQSPDSTQ